jgi:hypothetical protein
VAPMSALHRDVASIGGVFLISVSDGWALPPDAHDQLVARALALGGPLSEAQAWASAMVRACKAMAEANAWDRPDSREQFERLLREEALAHVADLVSAAHVTGRVPPSKVGHS